MTPMIWYVLCFLLFGKDGPTTRTFIFADHDTCLIAEAKGADAAEQNKDLTGWTIVGKPCEPTPTAMKS